jgi:hypothetical protein
VAPAGQAENLTRFCENFTEKARRGKIDPVFGRHLEIRQIVDILARRRKNNPIIVGEAGVGKTALVEGLAMAIVAGDVPEQLRNVELMGLDLGLLQAGAGVKGEFENRLKNVIAEVKASPKPIILFIDEAHTIIGAGGSRADRTRPTCSSRPSRAASCAPSRPPPGRSTRSTSSATRPWPGAFSPSPSTSPRRRTPPSCSAACARCSRSRTTCPCATRPSSPR